jgi:hypothetical protein
MDVIGGLTAAKLALDLAKDLREIDKSVDEATFKMKLAELMSALADTQVAFAQAKTKISDLEQQLAVATQGSVCPKCLRGRLKVVLVEKHDFAPGIEFHTTSCDESDCDYSNQRTFDANVGQYQASK